MTIPHEALSTCTSSILRPSGDNTYREPADTSSGIGSLATETYFTKIMNGPIASEDYAYGLRRDPDGISQRGIYQPFERSSSEQKWYAYLTSVTDNYGLDHGRPDLDLNQMDDHSAIDINYALDLINPERQTRTTFESACVDHGLANSVGGYYASPVPINIPRYLSPLPSTLVETPINLMYFHHFLNHTAKMLVAHDCGDNPFITVLPSSTLLSISSLVMCLTVDSGNWRFKYLEPDASLFRQPPSQVLEPP